MSNVKYFTTFAAESYPVEPRSEITLEEAQKLKTYYQATFSDAEKLQEFTKFSCERDADEHVSWVTSYSEQYEYWPNGRLKVRTLRRRDGTSRRWTFDDRPSVWSNTVSEWLSKWHSLFKQKTSATTAERLIICHQLISRIESQVLTDALQGGLDDEWAFAAIAERTETFKQLFELICPGSKARLSMLAASDHTHWKSLSGLDEWYNLGALAPAWDSLERFGTLEPVDLTSVAESESDGKEWLRANDVASLFAIPIRAALLQDGLGGKAGPTLAFQGDAPPVAAHLVLWLGMRPKEEQSAAVEAVFQRIGHLVQILISMATLAKPIIDSSASGGRRDPEP